MLCVLPCPDLGGADADTRKLLLSPSDDNPRSEDFIELKDGRVLFVYALHRGRGRPYRASGKCFSSDGGTWDKVGNVAIPAGASLSASLLRRDGSNQLCLNKIRWTIIPMFLRSTQRRRPMRSGCIRTR